MPDPTCPLCKWTIGNSFREHDDACLPHSLWPAVQALKDRIAELEKELDYGKALAKATRNPRPTVPSIERDAPEYFM